MKKRLRIRHKIGVYEGDTLDGKKHGTGVFKFRNGDFYKGDFRNDKIEGQGTLRFNNQNIYEGSWKNGIMNGEGVYHFCNKDRYEGEFKDGKRSGRGVSFYNSGDRFEGEYKFGMKDGKGVMFFSNGDQRYGEWKNGKEFGRMMYTTHTGKMSFQSWENGKFLKTIEMDKESLFGELSDTRRLAFLVGQNQGELRCSINDANRMEQSLRSFGYECSKITNVKHHEFESSFEKFIESVESTKNKPVKIFFYYSGHGFEEEGQLFLMCFGERNMNFQGLLKRLNRTTPKCHVNVVIDACRYNEDNNVWKAGGNKPMRAPQVQQFEKSFILGFSCASGRKSEAGREEKDLSIYTRELLASMKSGIPFLEIISGAGSRMISLNKVVRKKSLDHQNAWVNFTARNETFKSCL